MIIKVFNVVNIFIQKSNQTKNFPNSMNRMEHLDIINKYIETANHILMKRFGKQLPLKYYEFIRNERIFVRGNSYP